MLKKKVWSKPEITKIKLNPEQAILACCSIASAYKKTAPLNNYCSGSSGAQPCGTGGTPSTSATRS